MRYALLLLLSWIALGAHAQSDTMIEVNFMDQQQNSGGYVTRFLVTDDYLRMDFGQDREDYVLFDRKAQRIYSVTHDQRQVLLIEPSEVTVPKPEKWELTEDVLGDERGKRTFDIVVNGTHCSRITAVRGFLPEVAQAMSDYYALMSGAQSATYLATPPELRHPCDLARLVLEPRRWLAGGVPLHETNIDGTVRRLLDYQTGLPVRRGVFVVPESYRAVRLRDMQGPQPAP
jgi:hypothetical protein